VYEGDNPVASKNNEAGVIEFELSEEIKPNTPVDVSFNYNRNRELTVTIDVRGTKLSKTEKLRYDRPRSTKATAAPGAEEPDEKDWQGELAYMVKFARDFHSEYETYMEVDQRMKLNRDIERAVQLSYYPNEEEGVRMIHILQTHIFNSGLATQLFLADRSVRGVPPDVGAKITEAANMVREAYDRGDRENAAEQARLLKTIVAKALQYVADVGAGDTNQNFGDLLRYLGELPGG
jgi:molecular chaperone DnaK